VKGVTVMKSERRHELQHNSLADALGDWTVKLKPYSRMISGAVVLLLVLGVAVAWVSGKGERRVAEGWDEYFDAINNLDRVGLTEVAEKYAGTSVAPWARIVAADLALNEGTSQLFANKTQGRELLRQAVDSYQTVLNEAGDETLKQRALYGLGRAHESLAGVDDVEKARGDYQKLVEGWPSGVYSTAAKERLADLQRGSTKKFYDWFAGYEPPKSASPSGKKPEFIEESLNKTDVELPSALDDLKVDGPKIKTDSELNDIELPDAGPENGKTTEPGSTDSSVAKPSAEEPSPAAPATESPQPDAAPTPASTSDKPE
jgi:hypothetical protein